MCGWHLWLGSYNIDTVYNPLTHYITALCTLQCSCNTCQRDCDCAIKLSIFIMTRDFLPVGVTISCLSFLLDILFCFCLYYPLCSPILFFDNSADVLPQTSRSRLIKRKQTIVVALVVHTLVQRVSWKLLDSFEMVLI